MAKDFNYYMEEVQKLTSEELNDKELLKKLRKKEDQIENKLPVDEDTLREKLIQIDDSIVVEFDGEVLNIDLANADKIFEKHKELAKTFYNKVFKTIVLNFAVKYPLIKIKIKYTNRTKMRSDYGRLLKDWQDNYKFNAYSSDYLAPFFYYKPSLIDKIKNKF